MPLRSAGIPSSGRWPSQARGRRHGSSRPQGHCSGSARIWSTCCPTSPTTRPPASVGCLTGWVTGAVLAGVLATVAVLVGVTLVAGGRIPFRAAIGIALVDVLLLVLGG